MSALPMEIQIRHAVSVPCNFREKACPAVKKSLVQACLGVAWQTSLMTTLQRKQATPTAHMTTISVAALTLGQRIHGQVPRAAQGEAAAWEKTVFSASVCRRWRKRGTTSQVAILIQSSHLPLSWHLMMRKNRRQCQQQPLLQQKNQHRRKQQPLPLQPQQQQRQPSLQQRAAAVARMLCREMPAGRQ